MAVTIFSLNTKKQGLLNDAETLVNSGKQNTNEYRTFIAEIDGIQDQINGLERIERMKATDPAQPAPVIVNVAAPAVPESLEARQARINSAYRHLLRHGRSPHAIQQRDVITNTLGESLIPQGFDSAFTQASRWFGPIATLVKQKYSETGEPQKFVVSDDTASTMSLVSESNSATALEADPAIRSAIPGTDSLVTLVRYSLQELDDAWSLDAFIRDIAGLRVARAVEYALTLGKDNGTQTQLPNSPNGGLLGSVVTGVTTPNLASGISYQNLVSLAASVDHSNYVNGSYMASPSVFAYLVAQVDSTGRPFYKFDPATGLLLIAGKPLYVNAAMPAYNAASSPVVTFGDYSKAFAYLNAGGVKIQVLKERFVDVLDGALLIYHRLGSAALVSGAVKALVTAASETTNNQSNTARGRLHHGVCPFCISGRKHIMGVVFTGRMKAFIEGKRRKSDESLEELEARSERFARDAKDGIVVRLKQAPETTLQLPRELALALVRKRAATVVADLRVIPTLVLTEDDVDELQASGFDLWQSTEAVTQ